MNTVMEILRYHILDIKKKTNVKIYIMNLKQKNILKAKLNYMNGLKIKVV